jgi:hypothetical protein
VSRYTAAERSAIIRGARDACATAADLRVMVHALVNEAGALRNESTVLRGQSARLREEGGVLRCAAGQLAAVRAQSRSRPRVRASTRETHI